MTILITNPNYDDTTGYIYYYTKKIVDFAEENGKKVIHLKRPRLTKKEVSNLIVNQKPLLILFNGHGDDCTIYGDKIDGKEELIIQEDVNHHILKGKLIYARSCCAGLSLGKAIVRDNGSCFIGYNLPFEFWMDTRWSTNPAKDKTARLFLEPSNELAKFLIDGHSANESAERFQYLYKKNILNLLKNVSEPGATLKIKVLWNNMIGQVVHGNKNMRYSS